MNVTTITLKLNPAQYDLLKGAIKDAIQVNQEAASTGMIESQVVVPAMRRAASKRAAELSLLLTKL